MIDSETEMSDIGGRFDVIRDDEGVDRVEDRKRGTIYGVGRAFIEIA